MEHLSIERTKPEDVKVQLPERPTAQLERLLTIPTIQSSTQTAELTLTAAELERRISWRDFLMHSM